MTTRALRVSEVPRLDRWVGTSGLLAAAVLGSVLLAISNTAWFEAVNSVVGATGTEARGLLYSAWLVLLAAPFVVRRPATFGFQVGDLRAHLGLVVAAVVASVAVTVVILRVNGATPYSNASLFIEAVDVPVTEELLFRGVLLTALIAGLSRLWPRTTAVWLAIVFDGVAFGSAHLANLTTNAPAFTIAQSGFAAVLGALCALLMVRTRSVYPAMVLHAAVNATVVIAS